MADFFSESQMFFHEGGHLDEGLGFVLLRGCWHFVDVAQEHPYASFGLRPVVADHGRLERFLELRHCVLSRDGAAIEVHLQDVIRFRVALQKFGYCSLPVRERAAYVDQYRQAFPGCLLVEVCVGKVLDQ